MGFILFFVKIGIVFRFGRFGVEPPKKTAGLKSSQMLLLLQEHTVRTNTLDTEVESLSTS